MRGGRGILWYSSSFTVHGIHHCVAHSAAYVLFVGSVAVAGFGISWLRDNLRIIDSVEESATLAAQVTDTGGLVGGVRCVGLGMDMQISQGTLFYCSMFRGVGFLSAYQTLVLTSISLTCWDPGLHLVA